MSKLKFAFFVFAIAILASCADSSNDTNSINETLRELIKMGYSVKELSIRTDYDEETIINAFLKDENVLTDSFKNEKIQKIHELHEDGGIIPVNKTNISAYNSIWQIYTKAQNLPRTSIFSVFTTLVFPFALRNVMVDVFNFLSRMYPMTALSPGLYFVVAS